MQVIIKRKCLILLFFILYYKHKNFYNRLKRIVDLWSILKTVSRHWPHPFKLFKNYFFDLDWCELTSSKTQVTDELKNVCQHKNFHSKNFRLKCWSNLFPRMAGVLREKKFFKQTKSKTFTFRGKHYGRVVMWDKINEITKRFRVRSPARAKELLLLFVTFILNVKRFIKLYRRVKL